MRRIPIDQSALSQVLGLEVKPHLDRDNNQRKGLDEVPMWLVSVLVKESDAASFETLDIKIGAHQPPKVQPMQPISFAGLTASFWEMGGRSGTSFSAQGIADGAGKAA